MIALYETYEKMMEQILGDVDAVLLHLQSANRQTVFSKDKAGQLKYVYEDCYCDIITRIQGKVEKKCDENKKKNREQYRLSGRTAPCVLFYFME